ncbi:ABC transporter substrate-binding protein [Saccharopolyspora sp. K220]|uniref:ABC transporter substrate-binding protein n=1 Tax=Saccharopolyspora soli TaxID=2926618 RepID=UPI001F580277|nr:ABC transporter substrate-binding protein [Saccharopolyspora soli]MCI2422245.1 ABC transporter substrate-binding protein [Saccharopolyspora soli]
MRKLLVSLTSVVAAAALASCGTPAAVGGDPAQIKIGYPSDTASYGDLYVCQDEGIFAKHGLNVQLTLLKTSSQLVAALSSNAVQIAGGDGRSIATGALQDADLKMIELKLPKYFVEMFGEPGIKSVEDLRGKKIGVTAPGSVTDTATRIMLKDKGLTNDVQISNLTSLPALIAAAKSGEVNAIVTAPPQGVSTQDQGWHKITDMTNYKTAGSVYAVTGEFAKSHPETVSKFVKANVECLAYLQKDENRDKSIAAIQKHTKTEDPKMAAYAYDFFKKVWVTDPVVDEEIVREAFVEAAAGGPVPNDISRFIDNSFLDKLRAEGFIDQVTK